MRLTIEQDPESIRRYRHVKPARVRDARLCSARCPGSSRACTLRKGHRGPHVAHSMFKKVVAVWDAGSGVVESPEGARRAAEARSRRAPRVRSGRPSGVVGTLRDRVAGLGSSLADIGLLVLLLAFAGFAVRWLLIILRGAL